MTGLQDDHECAMGLPQAIVLGLGCCAGAAAADACSVLGCGAHSDDCDCRDDCADDSHATPCCDDYVDACVLAPTGAPTTRAPTVGAAATCAAAAGRPAALGSYSTADAAAFGAFLELVGDNLSGAAFDARRCTLWFLRNNPAALYEASLAGGLLRSWDLEAGGFYDTEAVAVLDSGAAAGGAELNSWSRVRPLDGVADAPTG